MTSASISDPGSGGGIGPLEVGVLLFVWILPAFLVARYAKRKGHSFLAFLLIGLLVSWVITGIAALIVEDKRTPREFVVAQAPVDRLDQLQKLTELRRAGTLSQDEFDAEKARIMGD